MVPPYNALDREDSSIAVKEDPKKSNKFPFKKEQVKTTEGNNYEKDFLKISEFILWLPLII